MSKDSVPPSMEGSYITLAQRWNRAGHMGCVAWFTGLSGSGKSTLSRNVERELFTRGIHTFLLDGDTLRGALNSDLGFSPKARSENVRRIAEVARLLAMSGQVTITASISPFRNDREKAREIVRASGCDFIEVFIDAPLMVCEARDPKGLYRRARGGDLPQFTGVDAPYETPETPAIHVKTAEFTIEHCVALIVEYVLSRLEISSQQGRS